MDPYDPYAALRRPDFRRLLAGNVLAALGSEALHVAASWELYERTGSYAGLGLVGLVQFLPVLLLSLPAGHLADRSSRKHLYAAAQGLMALSALGLATLSFLKGPIPLVYICLLLIGVARAFQMPSRGSLVPQLVPGELLSSAVAWNTGGWQLASVSGPALGGALLALFASAAPAYGMATILSLCCVVLVLSIRTSTKTLQTTAAPDLASLFAGLRFVARSRLLLATMTLDLFAVLLGGATALLPVFAKDVLHVGPTGLGWLRAAPSLGALAMAFYLTHRPPLRFAGPALLTSVAGFGVATIVFGLSESFWLSLVALALTGALDNISIVVRHTLVQKLTPDAMRGRVSAVNMIFVSSSNELGAFESGTVAALIGPIGSVVVGGFGTLIVVATAAVVWPEVERLGSLEDIGPATARDAAASDRARSP